MFSFPGNHWKYLLIIVSLLLTQQSVSGLAKDDCADEDKLCPKYSKEGRCSKDVVFMMQKCPKSCGVCDIHLDESDIRHDIGVPQGLAADADKTSNNNEILALMRAKVHEVRTYRNEVVKKQPKYNKNTDICYMHKPDCAYRAVTTPNFCKQLNDGKLDDELRYSCAVTCQKCDNDNYLNNIKKKFVSSHSQYQCYKYLPNKNNNSTMEHSIYPGDINTIFTRITSNPNIQNKYETQILSQPTKDSPLKPWVVVMDNIFTNEEAEYIINLSENWIAPYKKSSEDTKESATCFDPKHEIDVCTQDAVVHRVIYERIFSNSHERHHIYRNDQGILRIPISYLENLSFEKFTKGQHSATHHDYVPSEIDKLQGVPVVSVLVYLNGHKDSKNKKNVFKGGETNFPQLDISISPKLGRIVIFPNVMNDYPQSQDVSTAHQELPVKKGTKYLMNALVHLRDYQGPFFDGCL